MRETLSDAVVEGGTLLLDLLAAVVLTVGGLAAELQGVRVLGSDLPMAAWLGYVGLVALYAGVVVFGRGRLLPRLRARTDR